MSPPPTLSIDIGASSIKASVLDAEGDPLLDPIVFPTPRPCSPDDLVRELVRMAEGLPRFARASIGFPGRVRDGVVLGARHFVVDHGELDSDLAGKWDRFDLAESLAAHLGCEACVVNDAQMHGAAVVKGSGLELVLTLGTGFGSALFFQGAFVPHMELAFHPFRDGESYTEQLGQRALDRVGVDEWNARLRIAIDTLESVFLFDRLYLGGGNSRLVRGDLGPRVVAVENLAGILGGHCIWELRVATGVPLEERTPGKGPRLQDKDR